MLTLAINTSSSHAALALISEKKVVAETSWIAAHDESEKLLPALAKLLKRAKASFNDIKKIIVVCGPGPFSALRIGVTVANTLSRSLNATLYEIDSVSLWWQRLPTDIPRSQSIFLMHAGGSYVARCRAKKSAQVAEQEKMCDVLAVQKSLVFFGDITESETACFEKIKSEKNAHKWRFLEEKKLRGFGETASSLPAQLLKKCETATPVYWRPPNITTPK